MLFAGPGENLKIQVKGIEEGDVDRGYMVTNTDNFCIVAREFIAEITLLQLPEHKQIMSDGYTCVMHLHTSVEEISVVQVEALYEAETK